MLGILLQTQITPDNTSVEEVQEKTLSIMELITSGGIGGNIIMSVLGILSIFAIYILFERINTLNKAKKETPNFVSRIATLVAEKREKDAIDICQKEDTIVSRMMEKGLKRIGEPLTEIHSAMENQAKLEVNKLESNLTNLATISGAAPMIGFLGTVIGMILAFHDMASAGGNIDVEMLSKGIYTAMITTVAGLVVGIISFISYNFLLARVDKIVFNMEDSASELLDSLH
ncbi:MAG: MotA/TolQ/ExbB proton channel family protein [Flavobacteriales bacterium]|jgi:biopolymer transport protein ExbB|nr:MotA/TolQ/ExbB proton channel family protein [Flavobacteriales bacterium]